MSASPAVEARIREHVGRLERTYDRVTGCQVVIEAPPAHRRKGAPFDVKIDMTVPGAEICVRTERAVHEAHKDVYVALDDAFDVAHRLLLDHVREGGDVKRHGAQRSGMVRAGDESVRIAVDEGGLA